MSLSPLAPQHRVQVQDSCWLHHTCKGVQFGWFDAFCVWIFLALVWVADQSNVYLALVWVADQWQINPMFTSLWSIWRDFATKVCDFFSSHFIVDGNYQWECICERTMPSKKRPQSLFVGNASQGFADLVAMEEEDLKSFYLFNIYLKPEKKDEGEGCDRSGIASVKYYYISCVKHYYVCIMT